MLELAPLQEAIPVGGMGGLDWLAHWDGEAWALAAMYGVKRVAEWGMVHEQQETTRTEIREREEWP